MSDLVLSLRSNPPGAAEKRQQPRVGIRSKAEIQLRDPQTGFGAERLPVWVRDVSAGGVGLLAGRGLDMDLRIGLLLDGEESGTEEVPCVVVYCRSVGGGLFRVGAKFVNYEPRASGDVTEGSPRPRTSDPDALS